MNIEEAYVRDVYTKLAAHNSPSSYENAAQKAWPNVRQFVQKLPPGSLVVDVGCGPLKYSTKDGFLIGFDTCAEVLVKTKKNDYQDVILADVTNLPFRKDCADAVLCVSVLHHLPSAEKRRRAVSEIADILRLEARLVTYVWAKEQPYGKFPSQDVLVPWNLHEIPKKDYLPLVCFHKNSTREQRIIANSIPIDCNSNKKNGLLGTLLNTIQSKVLRVQRQIPPAVPQFLREQKVKGMTKIVSGVKRWSPALGRRLMATMVSVEELYATELSYTLMEEAFAEALSTLRKVTYYRYYHVFKRGELDELISGTGKLRITHSMYDSANWCAVAARI